MGSVGADTSETLLPPYFSGEKTKKKVLGAMPSLCSTLILIWHLLLAAFFPYSFLTVYKLVSFAR